MRTKITALLMGVMLLGAVAVTPMTAQAQVTGPISTALYNGLINVNVQDVANNLNNLIVVDVRNVSVLDGAQIDVLRDAVINVLSNDSNFLNNWNVLNNALREARLLNGNQVVIGILSGVVPVAIVDNANRVRLPR
jgi:hypothetical protein